MTGYDKAINALTKGDRHRVWSLIVTIFGDLAQNKGDEISAQTLGKITESFGVKAEALRVALYRLRKDGWIDSRRKGRTSHYFLTAFGLDQTISATPRIYGNTNPSAKKWYLVVASNESDASKKELESLAVSGDCIALGSNTLITTGRLQDFSAHLLTSLLDDAQLPAWMKQQVIGTDLKTSYDNLFSILSEVKTFLDREFKPVERAVLRTLIVHSWRRVLLRHPDAPDSFYPDDCKAKECRELVLDILGRLSRPQLPELSVD
ncbi:MAG: PaaX family transcriptional regulator C-terminal domain-containing protein [Paracoccaceae bacterium]|jgi:phenylacetic acid degradation operon negative regulatory protein|nr:PaaX family transcriptional regulator C-terminal domain-containing protein [Paracoccaceae bacterium]